MSSERINYVIFFIAAVAILSAAVLIEKPASLANAIPLQSNQEAPQGDGDGETADDNVQTTPQSNQEGSHGDGDSKTNDDSGNK